MSFGVQAPRLFRSALGLFFARELRLELRLCLMRGAQLILQRLALRGECFQELFRVGRGLFQSGPLEVDVLPKGGQFVDGQVLRLGRQVSQAGAAQCGKNVGIVEPSQRAKSIRAPDVDLGDKLAEGRLQLASSRFEILDAGLGEVSLVSDLSVSCNCLFVPPRDFVGRDLRVLDAAKHRLEIVTRFCRRGRHGYRREHQRDDERGARAGQS